MHRKRSYTRHGHTPRIKHNHNCNLLHTHPYVHYIVPKIISTNNNTPTCKLRPEGTHREKDHQQ